MRGREPWGKPPGLLPASEDACATTRDHLMTNRLLAPTLTPGMAWTTVTVNELRQAEVPDE
jgi:hypothetical protein